MTWLVLTATVAVGAALVVLYLARTAKPVPDYADPDLDEVPMEEFLDESSDASRARHE